MKNIKTRSIYDLFKIKLKKKIERNLPSCHLAFFLSPTSPFHPHHPWEALSGNHPLDDPPHLLGCLVLFTAILFVSTILRFITAIPIFLNDNPSPTSHRHGHRPHPHHFVPPSPRYLLPSFHPMTKKLNHNLSIKNKKEPNIWIGVWKRMA